MNNLENDMRNCWINNLLNWTKLEVLIKNKENLKRDMTWIIVSVIVNGNSYSYKVVNNNYIYIRFIKYKSH